MKSDAVKAGFYTVTAVWFLCLSCLTYTADEFVLWKLTFAVFVAQFAGAASGLFWFRAFRKD